MAACFANTCISKTFGIFCLLYVIIETHSIFIDIESFRVQYNEEIFKNITLDLITVGNRKVFNGSMIPAKDLHQAVFMGNLQVQQKNGRKFSMVNVTVDLCDSLSLNIGKSISFANLIVRDIRSVLRNMPEKCPLKKDTEVVVDMLYIDAEKWPIYLPLVQFHLHVTMKHKTALAYEIFVNGAILQRRRRSGGK